MFVLTFKASATTLSDTLYDGVYGVFSTLPNAMTAAVAHIAQNEDYISGMVNDTEAREFLYFCGEGTWAITYMEVDNPNLAG